MDASRREAAGARRSGAEARNRECDGIGEGEGQDTRMGGDANG